MDRIAIGFLGCKDGTTELSRVSFRSMYEDGSVMVKFFPSCWLDCLVGVLFDRRLVSVGLVLSCFFFFRVVGTDVLGHGALVRMQGSGCGTTWLDWREKGSESWCAW